MPNNFHLDPEEMSPDVRLAALAESLAEGFMYLAGHGLLGEFRDFMPPEAGPDTP